MLKHTKYHSLLLLIMICALQVKAQEDTLLVDELKPFDISFLLKYPIHSKATVSSASLFEIAKDGCLRTINEHCTFRQKLGIPKKSDNAISTELAIKGQDTNGNVFIEMKPLEPNQQYFLILNTTVVPDGIDDVLALLLNEDYKKAELEYTNLIATYTTVYTGLNGSCSKCKSIRFPMAAFSDFKDYYEQNNIKTLQKSIAENKAKTAAINDHLKLNDELCFTTITPADRIFRSLVNAAAQDCIKCKDTIWEYQWLERTAANPSTIIEDLELITKDVFYGYITLDNAGQVGFNGSVGIDQRITNLQQSAARLIGIIKQIGYFESLSKKLSAYPNYKQSLNTALDCLNKNLLTLKQYKLAQGKATDEISGTTDDIKDLLATYEGFTIPLEANINSTFSYSFETRADFAIKPDFGFMAYGNLNNGDLWGVSPYLGFHVNFRSLNSAVPFKLIKGFWKHISFNSGVLLLSLKEENKRDGLFGNTSIFTGLGYAFGHGVRLNGGSVWFMKEHENPLVSKRSIAATPYLGLSLDLRLRDIFNTFSQIFK